MITVNNLPIKVLKPKRTVIAAKVKGVTYKLLQIMYGKKDGSIYISFPYYENSLGLVSIVEFPGGANLPTDLSLTPGGKVTSHLVKYSHHPDGRAHFSQDSKVKTEIIKKSVPIKDINGHFFTVQLQGLHCYKSESKLKKNTLQRATIDFDFGNNVPESVKIVGRIYSPDVLIRSIKGKVEGPIVPFETKSGEKGLAFLIGDPTERIQEKVIMITCREIPRLDKDADSALTFIGGFDHTNIVNNTFINTSFLALSYPASDYSNLRTQLGSIDYEK